MSKSKLGVTLYTLRDFCQTTPAVAETLKKVSAIGYKVVQLSGIGQAVDPRDLGKIISDMGLTAAATHVGWDRFLNNLDAVIEEHKLYNCEHAAVGCLPQDYWCAEGLDRFIDEAIPVAEKLNQAGLDFSYHNHSHEFVRYGEKTWLEMLYERTDPKLIKAELDVYWVQHGGGDPAAWIRKCAGREPILHLKDMLIVPQAEQRFAEIGEGNLNWPTILAAAAESGVEWYIVEQDDCFGRDPFESLAMSYNNLKGMGLA